MILVGPGAPNLCGIFGARESSYSKLHKKYGLAVAGDYFLVSGGKNRFFSWLLRFTAFRLTIQSYPHHIDGSVLPFWRSSEDGQNGKVLRLRLKLFHLFRKFKKTLLHAAMNGIFRITSLTVPFASGDACE